MNKKIVKIIILIFITALVILGSIYLIDLNKMKNNEPVLFSTWGRKYSAPDTKSPTDTSKSAKLEDLPEKYSKQQAIEDGCFVIGKDNKIYNKDKLDKFIENTNFNSINRKEDTLRIVQFTTEGQPIITEIGFKIKDETYLLSGKPVNKTTYIMKKDNTRDMYSSEDNRKITIDEDIPGDIYTIGLQETCEGVILKFALVAEIQYVDDNSKIYDDINICSYANSAQVVQNEYFYGKVIQSEKDYILVEPNEDEEERKSSDKIQIKLGKNNDMVYKVGTNVKITYNGFIKESYPAQIEAINIEIKSTEEFEIRFYDKKPQTDEKIHRILEKSETDQYNYNIYAYDGSVNILINGEEMSLRQALLDNKITMDEIIQKANEDIPNAQIYKDGGSIVYNYKNYTIIKLHRLDGNRDVYIGSESLTLNDI